MSWHEIYQLLEWEALVEVKAEAWRAAQGDAEGLRGVLRETTDIVAFAAMMRDKAVKELQLFPDKRNTDHTLLSQTLG